MSNNFAAEVKARAREVDSLIGSKKTLQAVAVALGNPPIGCPDQAVKVYRNIPFFLLDRVPISVD